jgi:2'-5' RNA ligase
MSIIKTFSAWVKSLNESSKDAYDYGCAMVYYDMPQMQKIHEAISPDDVYTEDGDSSYGLEDEPHTTLLFGFHGDVDASDVLHVCNKFEYPKLELHNASCFNNDKYDVLKFDVNSPELHKVNAKLKSQFAKKYTSNFPDYHPHGTIAYIKKGKGQHYADLFKNESYLVTPKKLVYSMPSGDKQEVEL